MLLNLASFTFPELVKFVCFLSAWASPLPPGEDVSILRRLLALWPPLWATSREPRGFNSLTQYSAGKQRVSDWKLLWILVQTQGAGVSRLTSLNAFMLNAMSLIFLSTRKVRQLWYPQTALSPSVFSFFLSFPKSLPNLFISLFFCSSHLFSLCSGFLEHVPYTVGRE